MPGPTRLWRAAIANGETSACIAWQPAEAAPSLLPSIARAARILEALVDHLASAKRPADVVVNGAGVNAATPFLEITRRSGIELST